MRSTITNVLFFIFFSSTIFAQEANIRFNTEVDCNQQEYCVTLQIKSTDGLPFELGTSSLYFNYNEKALSLKSFTPHHFDINEKCVLDITAAYDRQQYDASHAGIINTTLSLKRPEEVCPSIGEEYLDISTFCFTIEDPRQSSQLSFNQELTNFNEGEQNITLMDFVRFNETNDDLSCTTTLEDLSAFVPLNNPVNTISNLELDTQTEGQWDIIIFDLAGKKVIETNENIINGLNTLSIDMSNLAKGMYVITATNGIEQHSTKVIKE